MRAEPMMDYAGKRGVIFGASSFVGKVVASDLVQRGVHLCLLDLQNHVDPDLLQGVQSLGSDGEVISKVVTSGEEDDFIKALDQAVDELGDLDYLICAFYLERGYESQGMDDLNLDSWDQLLGDWVVNTFLVTRAAFPHLAREGGGRIVFFNATTGYTGEGEGEGEVTVEGSILECACSSALTGMMTSIARDIIPEGVSVNGVALGPNYRDDLDRILWATDFWLSGMCDYACGQILRLY
ncbi:MAG: SDR family oxidoreductase [Anaerolineales bacterium]